MSAQFYGRARALGAICCVCVAILCLIFYHFNIRPPFPQGGHSRDFWFKNNKSAIYLGQCIEAFRIQNHGDTPKCMEHLKAWVTAEAVKGGIPLRLDVWSYTPIDGSQSKDWAIPAHPTSGILFHSPEAINGSDGCRNWLVFKQEDQSLTTISDDTFQSTMSAVPK